MTDSAVPAPGPAYVCVGCRAVLREHGDDLVCPECSASYPVLDRDLPVLVPNAASYLAGASVSLRSHELELDRAAPGSDPESQGPQWLADERAYVAALRRLLDDRDTVDGLLDTAEEWSQPTPTVTRAASSRAADRFSLAQYARRDWSRLPECEREIAAIGDAVGDEIRRLCERRDAVLVLGAGLGRHAAELLSLFENVRCFDHSFEAAATFQILRGRSLRFRDLTRNVRSDATAAADIELPAISVDPDRFSYAIADARKLPFADGSFSCVVSIFFSDLLPAPSLMTEVLRVLQLGGHFIHFGPLRGSAHDFRRQLESGGYEVVGERSVAHRFLDSERSLEQCLYESCCLSARKGNPPSSYSDGSIPTLTRPLELITRGSLGSDGHHVDGGEIIDRELGRIPLTGAAFDAVTQVDGGLTFAELVAGSGPAHRTEVRDALLHLVDLGLLQVSADADRARRPQRGQDL